MHIERHTQQLESGIDSFTPLGDAIYAGQPGGIFKWTGTKFERVTTEEEQKIGGRKLLIDDRTEFSNANGWSRRLIRAVAPGEAPVHGQFSIELNKQLNILVTEGNPTSVDLQRPGQSSERIWYHKQETSLVSEAKYKSVFKSH